MHRFTLIGISAIGAAATAYSYFRRRPDHKAREKNYVSSHLTGLSVWLSLMMAANAATTENVDDIIPSICTSLIAAEGAIACDADEGGVRIVS